MVERAATTTEAVSKAGWPRWTTTTTQAALENLSSEKIVSAREIVMMAILVPGDVFGLGTILTQHTDYIGTAESLDSGEVRGRRLLPLAKHHQSQAARCSCLSTSIFSCDMSSIEAGIPPTP